MRVAQVSSRPVGLSNYGTIDCGLETMTKAWTRLSQKFAVRRKDESTKQTGAERILYGQHRYPLTLLEQTPVHLLVVERGHIIKPSKVHQVERWEQMIDNTTTSKRPQIVVEIWTGSAQLWTHGPTAKSSITRWRERGFGTRCRRVSALQTGGAIHQIRLIVVRLNKGWEHQWAWAHLPSPVPMRPMSNLLTPPGLVPRNQYKKGINQRTLPDGIGTLCPLIVVP